MRSRAALLVAAGLGAALALLIGACSDDDPGVTVAPPPSPPEASDTDSGATTCSATPSATSVALAPAEWLDGYLAEQVAKLSGTIDVSPGVRLTPDRATPARRQIARTYLSEQLTTLGLTTSIDDYGTGANVVGRLAPSSGASDRADATTGESWIVVGAHYDGVEESPGANDNASGVAAVLAVAKIVAGQPCRKHGVMFVMFDEEETGLIGSAAFAKQQRNLGTEIIAAHTIDQVGWDSDADKTFEIELPTPALFAEYESSAAAIGGGVKVVKTNTASSDHSSFRKHGYAAAAGITEEFVGGDTTPHGHLTTDAVATIAPAYHALSVRLVTYVVSRELGAN